MKSFETNMEVRHLLREIRSALEMAVVAIAPAELLDPLARASGLLQALSELPIDCAPAMALTPKALDSARNILVTWHTWEQEKLKKAFA
jgi:hypothetical protein